MKDLLPESNPEKIEVHNKKEIEKQHKLVGSITPFKGHTLYEINCTTGDIVEAEYEVEAASYVSAVNGGTGKSKKVVTKENCLYISCLNKKSAQKKFLKYIIQNAISINKNEEKT